MIGCCAFCWTRGDNPPARRFIGEGIPLLSFIALAIIGFIVNKTGSLGSYTITSSTLGWMAVSVGGGSYLCYLSQKTSQLTLDTNHRFEHFLLLGVCVLPLLIYGGLGIGTHASVERLSLAIAVTSC